MIHFLKILKIKTVVTMALVMQCLAERELFEELFIWTQMALVALLKQKKLAYYQVTLIVVVVKKVTVNSPVKEHNCLIETEFENCVGTLNTIVLDVSF